MAKVQLADIIEPTVFTAYVVQRTNEMSRLFQSGIVDTDPQITALAQGAGRTFSMPFWKDLTGAPQRLSDTTALVPKKIQADKDVAVKHFLGDAWSANDLAKYVAGSDPMRAIADLVAAYWARVMQKNVLLPTLTGIFAGPLASTHVRNISIADGVNATDANKIGADAVIDAVGLLGDAWEQITGMVVHSAVFARMQKLGLVESEALQDQSIVIRRFLGREVIVDDGVPVVAGGTSGFVYTSYLFGNGSVGYGEGGPDADEAVETDRDSLAGDDILISRRHFILHPRGVSFTGTVAGVSPSEAELATAGSWTSVFENKSIKLLALRSNG